MEKIEWLNPWDCQMKRIVGINGVYPCLNANSGGGGRTDGVCFETDRSSPAKKDHAPEYPCYVACFQQNQREEVRVLGQQSGALTAQSGMHNTNYVIYPGVGITSKANGNNPKPGSPSPTITNDSRYYLVGVKNCGET